MAIIYTKNDRIKVKINEIEFHLAPLTYAEKSEAQRLISSGQENGAMDGSIYAAKCSIKDVKCLFRPDGSEYKLEFEGDKLSDSSLDDILNIEESTDLFIACLALMNGVPNEFKNPITGQKIEGIEILKEEASEKK